MPIPCDVAVISFCCRVSWWNLFSSFCATCFFFDFHDFQANIEPFPFSFQLRSQTLLWWCTLVMYILSLEDFLFEKNSGYSTAPIKNASTRNDQNNQRELPGVCGIGFITSIKLIKASTRTLIIVGGLIKTILFTLNYSAVFYVAQFKNKYSPVIRPYSVFQLRWMKLPRISVGLVECTHP